METPFEEVLERAKAGDPKAQTEVRTAVSGGRLRPWPPEQRAWTRALAMEVGAGGRCRVDGLGCSVVMPPCAWPLLLCVSVCLVAPAASLGSSHDSPVSCSHLS